MVDVVDISRKKKRKGQRALVKVRPSRKAEFCLSGLEEGKSLSDWTKERRLEIAREVCMRVEMGEPLSSICPTGRGTKGRYSDMPLYREWLEWVKKDEKIAHMIREARVGQVQVWVDEAMELSEAPISFDELSLPENFDELTPNVQRTMIKALIANEMNRRKLIIDTRKWYASSAAAKLLITNTETDDMYEVADYA